MAALDLYNRQGRNDTPQNLVVITGYRHTALDAKRLTTAYIKNTAQKQDACDVVERDLVFRWGPAASRAGPGQCSLLVTSALQGLDAESDSCVTPERECKSSQAKLRVRDSELRAFIEAQITVVGASLLSTNEMMGAGSEQLSIAVSGQTNIVHHGAESTSPFSLIRYRIPAATLVDFKQGGAVRGKITLITEAVTPYTMSDKLRNVIGDHLVTAHHNVESFREYISTQYTTAPKARIQAKEFCAGEAVCTEMRLAHAIEEATLRSFALLAGIFAGNIAALHAGAGNAGSTSAAHVQNGLLTLLGLANPAAYTTTVEAAAPVRAFASRAIYDDPTKETRTISTGDRTRIGTATGTAAILIDEKGHLKSTLDLPTATTTEPVLKRTRQQTQMAHASAMYVLDAMQLHWAQYERSILGLDINGTQPGGIMKLLLQRPMY